MLSDIGKLILRLNIGGMMLFHGIYKAMYGIEGVKGMIETIGIPGIVAYGVYIGEILAPIMLIIGFQVRIASVILILNMLVAIFAVTGGNIFGINQMGGWIIEPQAFYLFGALAIIFLGSGRFALDIKKAK
ncbi:DoxX family protein [Helicobacter cappadocius]|uniref:DoxX family protein n=1 Tax=Helicobacter cappadocius TaxID=3063998 RepID=A0AA90T9H9_9HELI|nr:MULTISPECIES: DoxX family protein [unclassified Helicobacter]MDO7252824.1 DoxX family protein [Helicobacter sp. faydin-H75]MDP2538867.1 DoxX family protein [Helicobacter sp. faydin-H76]